MDMKAAAPIRAIRLLPPALRNQIAAGEVVDRPAGVLKELVENSLDAGATDIQVNLEDGGVRLLSVRDNGYGIPAGDLKQAVTRHATSKLTTFEDLLRVSHYGFRGEALPSIASVADLTVTSAFDNSAGPADPADGADPAGSRAPAEAAFIQVRFAEVAAQGPAALTRGTLVEVQDLFGNVPARLKFLKNAATELKRCRETLVRLALPNCGVGFRLTAGGREVLRLHAGESLMDRLAGALQDVSVRELEPFDLCRNDMRARGLASPPALAQVRGDRIWLYVNDRPVNDRLLLKAVRQAYKGRLTGREYPQAVLFLDVDPQEVDVNVHPAKNEVRFRDERAIFGIVLRAVESALAAHEPLFGTAGEWSQGLEQAAGFPGSADPVGRASEAPVLPPLFAAPAREPRPQGFWGSLDHPRIIDLPPSPDLASDFSPEHSSESSHDHLPGFPPNPRPGFSADFPLYPPEAEGGGFSSGSSSEDSFTVESLFAGSVTGDPRTPSSAVSPGNHFFPPTSPHHTVGEAAEPYAPQTARPSGGFPVRVGSLLCLAQVLDAYLLLLDGDTPILVDQHAAHERALLHRFERAASQSRLLLAPVDIPLSPEATERLAACRGKLLHMGWVLEDTPAGLRVLGLPTVLDRAPALESLRDILAGRTEGFDDILHLMACRNAIKAGQRLTADEAAGLLALWLPVPERDHCPHGRPTAVRLSRAMLDKLFKRGL